VAVTRRSAGVLVHRRGDDGGIEVLLGHMGGPFWARKEERAWSVPKGEHPPEEDAWVARKRPGQCDPLALSARELSGLDVGERLDPETGKQLAALFPTRIPITSRQIEIGRES